MLGTEGFDPQKQARALLHAQPACALVHDVEAVTVYRWYQLRLFAALTQPGGRQEAFPDQDVPLLAGVLDLGGDIGQAGVQFLVLL